MEKQNIASSELSAEIQLQAASRSIRVTNFPTVRRERRWNAGDGREDHFLDEGMAGPSLRQFDCLGGIVPAGDYQ